MDSVSFADTIVIAVLVDRAVPLVAVDCNVAMLRRARVRRVRCGIIRDGHVRLEPRAGKSSRGNQQGHNANSANAHEAGGSVYAFTAVVAGGLHCKYGKKNQFFLLLSKNWPKPLAKLIIAL